MKRKTLILALKIAAGIALLAAVFLTVGVKRILEVLQQTHPGYYAAAFLVFLLSVAVAAFNLKLMLDPVRRIPFLPLLQHTLISNRVASLLTPGRLGEYSILLLLKNAENIPYGAGAAAVTADKLITLGVSSLIAVAGLGYFFDRQIAVSVALGLGVLLAGTIALLHPATRGLLKRLVLRRRAALFSGFSATLIAYVTRYRTAAVLNVLVTLIRAVLIALSAFFMFAALGVYPNLLLVIAIGSLETIATLLPITVSGLGVKQSIGVYLYSLIGIAPEAAAARYVLGFSINYGFALLSLLIIRNPVRHDENPH